MSDPLTRRLRAALCCALLFGVFPSGCAPFVSYSDELKDGAGGRSSVVGVPAEVGGFAGFVVGLPVTLVALPATYGVYRYQKSEAPLRTDRVSTLLSPAFVFWRAGTIVLGAPFDLIEYGFWRAWVTPPTPTRAEIEAYERSLDAEILRSYPVRTIYPDRNTLDRIRGLTTTATDPELDPSTGG